MQRVASAPHRLVRPGTAPEKASSREAALATAGMRHTIVNELRELQTLREQKGATAGGPHVLSASTSTISLGVRPARPSSASIGGRQHSADSCGTRPASAGRALRRDRPGSAPIGGRRVADPGVRSSGSIVSAGAGAAYDAAQAPIGCFRPSSAASSAPRDARPAPAERARVAAADGDAHL